MRAAGRFYRSCDPSETFARVRPFARHMGVTRIGTITGLDHIGIPVAMAVRPNSRSVSVSLGKGLSLIEAKTAALMEAAENFHGEELAERFRFARHGDLPGARACPGLLPRTSVPLPGDAVIPWIEGFDLLQGEACWVPAELVHTDCTIPPIRGSGYFLTSSNGLGAGNTRTEALVAAICEVIERDAVSVWRARSIRARARCRLVGGCGDLLALYEAAGMAVRLWDVTSDIGVATFICDIRPRDPTAEPLSRRFRGGACHPDPSVALSGAMTEAAQTRLTYISGTRDDLPAADYRDGGSSRISEALLDAFAAECEGCDFAAVPGCGMRALDDVLRWLLDRLAGAGCRRVIAVNLTRPEIGIPVVRVIIPGLESAADDPRYRPGPRARAAAEGVR